MPVRLTEILIHGVGGTPPETMLGHPAPVQVAGDRLAGFYRTADAVDRHREAYSWGGLTSRARSRALWTLLIPSMLMNMAGWMGRLPEVDAATAAQRAPTTRSFRVAARLTALALTVVTSALVVMLTVDVLAYQCWGQDVCVEAGPLDDVVAFVAPVDRPGTRLAVGGALAGLVALAFHLLARSTRVRYESVEPPSVGAAPVGAGAPCTPAALPGGLRDDRFWAGARWHEHLSDLHLSAALAVVTVVVAWPARTLHVEHGTSSSGGAVLAQVAAVGAVAVLAAVLVWLGSDSVPQRRARRGRSGARASGVAAGRAQGVSPSHLLLWVAAVGAALAGVAGLLAPRDVLRAADARVNVPPAPLLDLQGVVQGAVVGGVVLATALVVQQLAAWLRHGRRYPRGQKVFPWCGPVVMSVVAMTVAVTVLLGAVVSVAGGLGVVEYGVPGSAAQATGSTIWVATAVGTSASLLGLGLVAVLVAFGVVAWLVTAWPRRRATVAARLEELLEEYGVRDRDSQRVVPPVAAQVVPGTAEAWTWSAFLERDAVRPAAARPFAPTANGWVRSVLRRRFLATHSQDLAAGLVIPVAVLGIGVVVLAALARVTGTEPAARVELGSRIAALLPVGLLLVLTLTFRRREPRRGLGVAFDVGSFFPRAFHPFAPPSYTERAVPELLRRVWYLQDSGDAVVLVAHSQGSVVAAAALARPCEGRAGLGGELGLVTLGSPLGKLYRWAFPAVVSDDLLAGLADATTPRAGVGRVRWINLYYRTDYVGQEIGGEASVGLAGGGERERELRDPRGHEHVFGQPRPPVVSHAGYWHDEAQFWPRVADLRRHVREACDADGAARGRPGAGAAPPDYVPPAETAWEYRSGRTDRR